MSAATAAPMPMMSAAAAPMLMMMMASSIVLDGMFLHKYKLEEEYLSCYYCSCYSRYDGYASS